MNVKNNNTSDVSVSIKSFTRVESNTTKNRNYDRYSRAIMIMILGIVTMFFPIVFKVIFKL